MNVADASLIVGMVLAFCSTAMGTIALIPMAVILMLPGVIYYSIIDYRNSRDTINITSDN